MAVHITITDETKEKVNKAIKPARKPKEDPGLMMKNLAMKLYSARQRNG